MAYDRSRYPSNMKETARRLNGNIRELLLSGLNLFAENVFKYLDHGSFKNIIEHVFEVQKLREARNRHRFNDFLHRTQKHHTRLFDAVADGVTKSIHKNINQGGVHHDNAVVLQFCKELRLPGNVAFVFGLESERSTLGQHFVAPKQDAVDLGRGAARDELRRSVGIIGPTVYGKWYELIINK